MALGSGIHSGDTRGCRRIPGDGPLITLGVGNTVRITDGDGGLTVSGGTSQIRPDGW